MYIYFKPVHTAHTLPFTFTLYPVHTGHTFAIKCVGSKKSTLKIIKMILMTMVYFVSESICQTNLLSLRSLKMYDQKKLNLKSDQIGHS